MSVCACCANGLNVSNRTLDNHCRKCDHHEESHGFTYTPYPDMVSHPPHYTSHPSGVECITITEHMNFNLGNALKYIWRADLKGSDLDDLKKAAWYIEREIQRRRTAERPHKEGPTTA